MNNTIKIWVEWNLIELKETDIKRLGLIGCWSHVYRNIIPALRFVENQEIVATCDLNIEKAEKYARHLGAKKY